MNLPATTNESNTSCTEKKDADSLFFVVRIVMSSVLITLVFVSNSVLALFLWRSKSARKIKNGYYGFYLINLCVIDFSAAINYTVFTTCSILLDFTYDCPPAVLWRAYSSVHILLSSAWIGTVAVMVFERLLLAKNKLLRRKSLRRMKYKLYFTWVWALLNALPQLIWYDKVNVEIHCACSSPPPSEFLAYKRIYPVCRIVTMFVLPSSLIIVSVVGVLTRHSCESALSLKRKKGHERFVHLVMSLWLTFVCSNTPKLIFEIAASLKKLRQFDYGSSTRRYKHMFIILASWTIHLITPFIYFIIYAKILKSDFKKLRKHYPSEIRRMSYYASRKCSADPISDLDCLSMRNFLLNLGMHQDNILQRLSIELGNDDVTTTYGRRASVMGDHMRKHSIFGNDNRKIGRRQSIFRKRSSATADSFLSPNDGRFLTPFPPTFEHSVNTLNQTTPLLEDSRPKSKTSSITIPFFGDR